MYANRIIAEQKSYGFKNLGKLGSVFFFPVKIKSARESPFLLFLRFFSRVEIRFHAHFFEHFHG